MIPSQDDKIKGIQCMLDNRSSFGTVQGDGEISTCG